MDDVVRVVWQSDKSVSEIWYCILQVQLTRRPPSAQCARMRRDEVERSTERTVWTPVRSGGLAENRRRVVAN